MRGCRKDEGRPFDTSLPTRTLMRAELALEVVEQARRATALSERTLTLGRNLSSFFAVLATNREGQRAQPRLGDFVTALEAQPVAAFLEARQRFVDLVEGFRFHLNQSQFDILLDVDLGGLALIHDFVRLLRAVGTDTANLALDLDDEFALTILEHLLQLVIP
jgi:hypothetical protein